MKTSHWRVFSSFPGTGWIIAVWRTQLGYSTQLRSTSTQLQQSRLRALESGRCWRHELGIVSDALRRVFDGVERRDGDFESRHPLFAHRKRAGHRIQGRTRSLVARHDQLPELSSSEGRHGRAIESGQIHLPIHDLHRLSLLRHARSLPRLGVGNHFLQPKDVDAGAFDVHL